MRKQKTKTVVDIISMLLYSLCRRNTLRNHFSRTYRKAVENPEITPLEFHPEIRCRVGWRG